MKIIKKRKLELFIIIATLFLIFSTPSTDKYQADKTDQSRLSEIAPSMKLIEINDGKYFVTYYAYDKDTKVIYNINVVERGNNRYSTPTVVFTQLSNSDGTPKLYKGDK